MIDLSNSAYIDTDLTRELESITEKLNLKNYQIQLNEAIYTRLFELAPIPLALVDTNRVIIKHNKALTDVLLYEENELVGQQFDVITHPDDLNLDVQLFDKLTAGIIEYYDIRKRYIRKDGEILSAILRASLVRDIENQPVLAIGLFYDYRLIEE